MTLGRPSRRAFLAGSALALGGGAYYLTRSGGDEAPDVSPDLHPSDATSELGVELAGKPIVGSPEAPIEIYYWTDFQCPYCEWFEREALPHLVSDHVESGRVRIVFIILGYFGEDSVNSSVAARCVWDQVRDSEPSAYWDWHEAVFAEQGDRNSGWAAIDNLTETTRSVPSVNADDLETCVDDRRSSFEDEIDADTERAESLQITEVPSFIIFNPESGADQRLTGAQPSQRFTDVIDSLE